VVLGVAACAVEVEVDDGEDGSSQGLVKAEDHLFFKSQAAAELPEAGTVGTITDEYGFKAARLLELGEGSQEGFMAGALDEGTA